MLKTLFVLLMLQHSVTFLYLVAVYEFSYLQSSIFITNSWSLFQVQFAQYN